MMGALWMKWAVGAAIVTALVGAGWVTGYGRAEDKIGREAKVLVLQARSSAAACQMEISKYNAATAEIEREEIAELKRDRERSAAARRSLEKAAADLAAMQGENLALAQLAREYLKDASDACSGAVMAPDFNSVLDKLANPTRYSAGGLPPGPGAD